jgi:DNA polymerase alpha subunit A
LAERAYHPEELAENPKLKVDLHYYLSQQIHPVISRLCAPIEQTDGAIMAECLGLDASKFKSQQRADEDDMDMFTGGNFALDDEERFKDCKPLTLTTKNGIQFDFCGIRDVMEGTVDASDALAPSTPGKENAPVNVGKAALVEQIETSALVNQVQLAVRERIKEYYAAPLRSDDDVDCERHSQHHSARASHGRLLTGTTERRSHVKGHDGTQRQGGRFVHPALVLQASVVHRRRVARRGGSREAR